MVTHRKGSCSGAVGAGWVGLSAMGQGWRTAAIHRIVKVEDGAKGTGADTDADGQRRDCLGRRRKECTAQTTRIFQSGHLA